MTKISNKINLRVRYAETDKMGVVYHGNYAQYFEVARIEWLKGIGVSYKELESSGVMLPVVSLSTKFLKSAFFDDELTITTILTKEPTAKIEFSYTIHNQKGELLTTGETTLVFVSMETSRPIKCPAEIMKLILEHSQVN